MDGVDWMDLQRRREESLRKTKVSCPQAPPIPRASSTETGDNLYKRPGAV